MGIRGTTVIVYLFFVECASPSPHKKLDLLNQAPSTLSLSHCAHILAVSVAAASVDVDGVYEEDDDHGGGGGGTHWVAVALVSLTCICCKTLEHILVSNINKHLTFSTCRECSILNSVMKALHVRKRTGNNRST